MWVLLLKQNAMSILILELEYAYLFMSISEISTQPQYLLIKLLRKFYTANALLHRMHKDEKSIIFFKFIFKQDDIQHIERKLIRSCLPCNLFCVPYS